MINFLKNRKNVLLIGAFDILSHIIGCLKHLFLLGILLISFPLGLLCPVLFYFIGAWSETFGCKFDTLLLKRFNPYLEIIDDLAKRYGIDVTAQIKDLVKKMDNLDKDL